MKPLALLLFLALLSCDENEYVQPYPDEKLGCQYTAPIEDPAREFIRCATYKEFKAHADVSQGGTELWTQKNTWRAADSCNECP